jgi:gluconokinase
MIVIIMGVAGSGKSTVAHALVALTGILTCSALKQSYRDLLVKDLPAASYRFVLLEAPVAVLETRMHHRPDHFMNPGLLQSQLDTLEMPADALRIDTTQPPEVIAREILAELRHPHSDHER